MKTQKTLGQFMQMKEVQLQIKILCFEPKFNSGVEYGSSSAHGEKIEMEMKQQYRGDCLSGFGKHDHAV